MRPVQYDFPPPGALVRVPTVDRPMPVRTSSHRGSTKISRLLSDCPSQQPDEASSPTRGWLARLASALE